MRGDDSKVSLTRPAVEHTDVLRRRRAAPDADTTDRFERLLVEQPNPMLARTVAELVAETKIVVANDGRQRSDVRCNQTREHVIQIA